MNEHADIMKITKAWQTFNGGRTVEAIETIKCALRQAKIAQAEANRIIKQKRASHDEKNRAKENSSTLHKEIINLLFTLGLFQQKLAIRDMRNNVHYHQAINAYEDLIKIEFSREKPFGLFLRDKPDEISTVAEAYLSLASVYSEHDDLDKAKEVLTKAIAKYAKFYQAYTARSEIHRIQGQPKLGLLDTKKALNIIHSKQYDNVGNKLTDLEKSYSSLCCIYEELGNYEQAFRSIDFARKRYDHSVKLQITYLRLMEKYDPAVDLSTQYQALNVLNDEKYQTTNQYQYNINQRVINTSFARYLEKTNRLYDAYNMHIVIDLNLVNNSRPYLDRINICLKIATPEKINEAKNLCWKVLNKYPDDIHVRLTCGYFYNEINDIDQALRIIDKAPYNIKDSRQLRLAKIRYLRSRHEHEQVKCLFKQIITQDNKEKLFHIQTQITYAHFLEEMGAYDKARDIFSKILKLRPNGQNVLLSLANNHIKSANKQRQAVLTKYEYLSLMGRTVNQSLIAKEYKFVDADLETAETLLREVVKKYPNNPKPLSLLARLLIDRKKFDEGLNLLIKINAKHNLGFDSSTGYVNGLITYRGSISTYAIGLYKAGERAQAISILNNYLKAMPLDKSALTALAICYKDEADLKNMLIIVNRITEHFPKYLEGHMLKGEYLMFMAAKYEVDGDNANANSYYKNAIDYFEKQLVSYPYVNRYHLLKAICHYSVNEYTESENILSVLAKKNPAYIKAFQHYAICLWNTSKFDEAIKQINHVLKLTKLEPLPTDKIIRVKQKKQSHLSINTLFKYSLHNAYPLNTERVDIAKINQQISIVFGELMGPPFKFIVCGFGGIARDAFSNTSSINDLDLKIFVTPSSMGKSNFTADVNSVEYKQLINAIYEKIKQHLQKFGIEVYYNKDNYPTLKIAMGTYFAGFYSVSLDYPLDISVAMMPNAMNPDQECAYFADFTSKLGSGANSLMWIINPNHYLSQQILDFRNPSALTQLLERKIDVPEADKKFSNLETSVLMLRELRTKLTNDSFEFTDKTKKAIIKNQNLLRAKHHTQAQSITIGIEFKKFFTRDFGMKGLNALREHHILQTLLPQLEACLLIGSHNNSIKPSSYAAYHIAFLRNVLTDVATQYKAHKWVNSKFVLGALLFPIFVEHVIQLNRRNINKQKCNKSLSGLIDDVFKSIKHLSISPNDKMYIHNLWLAHLCLLKKKPASIRFFAQDITRHACDIFYKYAEKEVLLSLFLKNCKAEIYADKEDISRFLSSK